MLTKEGKEKFRRDYPARRGRQMNRIKTPSRKSCYPVKKRIAFT